MQLLFETSEEGEGSGLSVFRGRVRKLSARRIPQMGWNDVEPIAPDPLFNGLDSILAYYANSYVADATDDANVLAWTVIFSLLAMWGVRRSRART